MVDAVVSYVVQRLGDFLIREAVFLRGVNNEVKWLKDELGWMQCFLKDAEEKQYGDALISKWVSDIRELAYDIEDVLDTFHLKVHGRADDRRPKLGCFPSVCCIYNIGKENVSMYNMGKEIEELKNTINDLSRRRELYGLRDSGNRGEGIRNSTVGRLRELRRSTSFAVEENVVGFEDDSHLLLAKLLDADPWRLVISIYGMGGLGKTTLARKLYHNSDVKARFMNCCAWVSVSQDYTTRDLLRRIIKSFNISKKMTEDLEKRKDLEMMDLEKMNEEDLGRYLYESLQNRSYVVVIDDVWDKEAWEILKRAFPDNKNGSRVIITTRSREAAERSDERTYAHKLQYLPPRESWQLFYEKAFQNLKADDELEKLGRQMVQKCDGLPLAIIVLGGLLSTKKPQEWRVVRDHIWQRLKDDSVEISNLLALSFDDLSYQLKQCFLYIGLFPEDFEINVEKLIHLFVAEGFISQDEDHTMEDVAKDYLDQLINRSLIQVDKIRWGRVATCRVHDLLRDLAIEKAKNLNFVYMYDDVKHSHTSSIISSCSRQAVYSNEMSPWLQECNPRLRSLFLFDTSQQLVAICSKFSSLRVLVVGFAMEKNQQMFAEVVGKLIHLKYLRLEGTRFDLSSWSIFNLQRLQTLDLCKMKYYVKLPAEISKLQELRHLIGKFSYGSLPIDSLTKLQTLRYVHNENWIEIKTEKLINLRELWLHGYMKEHVFTFDSIVNLKNLRILSVTIDDDKSFASVEQLSHCPHLIDLRLWGKIDQNLPEDIHELLPNLECLSLGESQLDHDPMPLLEKFSNLMILDFGPRFYHGEKIICTAKGFLRLEIIRFDVINEIEEWQVEEGALPRLRGLWIRDDSELTIPERLRSIPPPDKSECNRTFV
ncbi:hypothetical protein ACOSQ3_017625 [Xanthoceras sorbifolium]